MGRFLPATILILAFSTLVLSTAKSQIVFDDVSEETKLNHVGKSFGSAWGDINGDGRLDLFMSGHFKIHDGLNSDAPHIYKQNEDGTFEAFRLSFLPQTDLHGAGFFDLDNDGRMDLLNLTGRTSHDVLIKNDGNFNVVNRAVEFGLENENGRGRMPTFVDVNGDGF